ncbi:MAG TPA: (Fe-S)-binding protein [Xanthobacteraceae bacterium]|nr:(Fe-S)-binding protein [Xanthobacteraceae bacterium]
MPQTPFELAVAGRVDAMVDACTRCGKCVEACPVTEAAGMAAAEPTAVIAGVLDILRTGDGPQASRQWASSCVLSGECIKACDYGVNPRFLLAMARTRMARAADDEPTMRRRGVENFRNQSHGVNVLARLQLDNETLDRLAQTGRKLTERGGDEEAPDFVFYTGCNVLKTPHIALLALDIMDALDVTYLVMGGPTHCCGVLQLRAGDTETFGRFATSTLDKLSQGKAGVLSWCPSCHVQFTEITIPAIEATRGSKPFEMTPFMRFLAARLDDLRPLLRERVDMRIALHRHPGIAGAMEAAERILRAVPGIELVELHQPAVALQTSSLRVLPEYRRELQRKELEAARAARVDALVAVYHSDHRDLCAHERDWPFRIMNVLEIVGASMGISEADHFKRLKIMQDADAIVADCADLLGRHGIDATAARAVVAEAMLAEQPVPLMKKT